MIIPPETHNASAASDSRMIAGWTGIIALAAAICVVIQSNVVLSDPDTQWHIAVGRLMWETGAFPRVDTMSHTYAGQPWIAKEWLSQALLFAAYSLGGWPGVQLISALGVAACAGIIAHRLLQVLPPLMTVLLSWLVIQSLLGITTARPHVMALPVMALFIHLLLKAADGSRRPPWLALPVLALWANLHAAFTLGFIIAACLALDAIIRADRTERPRLLVQWGLFGLGCVAAACVHPYGWQSLLINIDMARGNESVPLIGEWNHHEILGPTGFRILVPALLIGTLALNWRTNAARLLLGVFALYLTWKHQRFIMLLAVLAPMITRDSFFAAVTALLRRFNLFQGADPLRDGKWHAPVAIGCISGLIALPVILDRPNPPAAVAPMAALESVPAAMRSLPGYNSYNYGGFLILNGVRTFIDGRTDQLFTNNFMGRFFGYLKKGDEASFLTFIDAYGPRWAIVQKGDDDVKALEKSPRWRETFSDEHAKVFIRVDG
jgi:hypothetical protein